MLVGRRSIFGKIIVLTPFLCVIRTGVFGLFLIPTTKATLSRTSSQSLNSHQESQQQEQRDPSLSTLICEENTLNNNNNMTHYRSVRKVLPRTSPHWVGDGFRVYPVFASSAFTEEVSPLLMFDYAEPKKFPAKVGDPLGVGQHPHRGFETVTVAFQGEIEHQDSTGITDVIGEGDVQWMTAGRGIIHQEFHSNKFTKTGGTLEMCQLWVNLPKKYKMTKPRYQAILKKDIPVVTLPVGNDSGGDNNNSEGDDNNNELVKARIIAGELGNVHGAAKTFSPVQMWDVILPKANMEVDLPYPADHQCMIFVRRGSVDVLSGELSSDDTTSKSSTLGPQDVAIMRMDGSNMLRLRVKEPNSSIMILGGEPLNEPIAAQGPFVMNTYDEIRQAINDYTRGKFDK